MNYKIFLLDAIFFLILSSSSVNAQATYFNVYGITFYDGNGNVIEKSREYNMVIKVSDSNLIISGGTTFWFFGRVTRENSHKVSQMARPDDGSGNCKVIINYARSDAARITIGWTNLIVSYDCNY